ncbi:nickel-binding protein [Elongatibacter sediminis]|uniref:Nickel-binding protein n=1 Tax=Elongatibacter sediminis TaxID=3119006 RepID=A0AAW9RIE7_9GAMM
MPTYVILRRGAWEDATALEASAAESTRVADEEMDDRVRWIRSYVIEEEDGTLGTVCIYEAEDEAAVLDHAQRADLPADEVLPVVDTVIVREDS